MTYPLAPGESSGSVVTYNFPPFDARRYGAVGDTVTNDSVAIAAALTAASARGGEVVFGPVGAASWYRLQSALQMPEGTGIRGEGWHSNVYYEGSGAAVTFGPSTGAQHGRGKMANMVLVLRELSSTGVRLAGTQGVALKDVYVEGPVSYGGTALTPTEFTNRTNIGVDIDGDENSSFYNMLDNVAVHHFHTCIRIGSQLGTGVGVKATNQTFINVSVFGDNYVTVGNPATRTLHDSGSIGYLFEYNGLGLSNVPLKNGEGSVVIGGCVENCATGMYIDAVGVTVIGTRFEIDGNSTSIEFGPNSANCRVYACQGLHRAQVIDNGTNNVVYYLDESTEPVAPTLQNSWVNFGGGYTPAGYFRTPDGIVHLQGSIKSGTTTAGTLLFTLPTGYRPSAILRLPVLADGTLGYIAIEADGEVRLEATGTSSIMSLDGISFRAD